MRIKRDPLVRFFEKTKKKGDCLEWTGPFCRGGYGSFHVDGKQQRAHRWLYFQLHPDADRSLDVCHSCDNPPCVNPDHLWLGAVSDNLLDSSRKGRYNHNGMKGEKHPMHKLSEKDVLEIRSSKDTPRSLSDRLGVQLSNIYNIRRRLIWKSI